MFDPQKRVRLELTKKDLISSLYMPLVTVAFIVQLNYINFIYIKIQNYGEGIGQMPPSDIVKQRPKPSVTI